MHDDEKGFELQGIVSPSTPTEGHMLPLIAAPESYDPSTWNLHDDDAMRAYWTNLFRSHFPRLMEEAIAASPGDGSLPARMEAAWSEFRAYLDAADRNPQQFEVLTILEICKVRERVLRRHNVEDPYAVAKSRENDRALAVLPRLLSELDAVPESHRIEAITQGIFAGNIFDLGATDTERMFRGKSVDFHAIRDKLKPRPWLIDDYDAWLSRLSRPPGHRCALLFVDNAGSDIVLGMLPLTRELIRRGTRVILTANSAPSLNDITHDELVELLDQVAEIDPPLHEARTSGQLLTVPSGNWLPLIDMRSISGELLEAVRNHPVDLLVIEGMGRAVESNLNTQFACDTLKIAMIKDQGVADALGGALYDLVLRFELAAPAD